MACSIVGNQKRPFYRPTFSKLLLRSLKPKKEENTYTGRDFSGKIIHISKCKGNFMMVKNCQTVNFFRVFEKPHKRFSCYIAAQKNFFQENRRYFVKRI